MTRSRKPALAILVLALAAAAECSALTVADEGEVAVQEPVECGDHKGTVVVATGVEVLVSETTELGDVVSIDFRATTGDALECCWVQFAWSEVIVTAETPDGSRRAVRVPGTVRTTGGEDELTTDPMAPKWSVDCSSKTSPCYEVDGLSVKDRKGTRMFDRPGSLAAALGPKMTVPAGVTLKSVEDRKHFEAYLICNGRVCYRVTWTQRYVWEPSAGAGPPVHRGPAYTPKPAGEAVTTLRSDQEKALDSEYKGQTTVR